MVLYNGSWAALSVVIIAGFLMPTGECIHCWECNSQYDPNCGEPFKNHTIALADCTQRFLKHAPETEATICRKITQKVQGETRTIRSCGYLNPEDAGTCINRAGTHLVFMNYCQCAGEGCNKTSYLKSSPLGIFLLFASLLLFDSAFS